MDMNLDVIAHELHAHCTKNDIPHILAAHTNGTVTDVIGLISVLLVQMSEDTGNDLDELLAYLRLTATQAQDVYRSNNGKE